jgi:hypothetical protein
VQASLRRGLKIEAPFIEMGEAGDDGEPKSAPWLRLIESLPTRDRLGPVRPGEPRSIVIQQDLEIAGTVASCGADPDLGLAHLQALSRRFPTISSKSCFSPWNLSPGLESTVSSSARLL